MSDPARRAYFEKLIRDAIPGLSVSDGSGSPVRTAARDELALLFVRKLIEESTEVGEALALGDPRRLAEELADLRTVIDDLAALQGIDAYTINAAIERKRQARGGFLDHLVLGEPAPRYRRLHVGGSESLLDEIRRELARCRSASFAVAFLMGSGMDLLEGAIRAALLRGAHLRFLTTDYLDTTEPAALRRLLAMPGRLDARVWSNPARSFHPKAYLFEHGHGAGRAFIGSANFSLSGLVGGVEWTWTALDFDPGHPMGELAAGFATLFDDPSVQPLTPAWIDAYEARRQPRTVVAGETLLGTGAEAPAIEPRGMQPLALRELQRLRADGARRALVVAATGLGKTFLAAFDAAGFGRTLFVAHREELLAQAEAAYAQVYPRRSLGRIQGPRLEADRDMVFASIQTLRRPEVLDAVAAAGFEHVVIDEFHHASADSYQRVLDRLAPEFLLGLTATPYRADNRDIHALCDDNVAFEVGLFQAIGWSWLCPFRYFGVADVVRYDDTLLNVSRTAYDVDKLTLRFNTPQRAALVLQKFREHDSRAALGFCVSIEHARFMAQAFTDAGVPALAVHSGPGSADRAESIARLTRGEVRVLFTVDLFNEGVDIPCVDLVMFLRPTESMTVFVQQLGRGLRLHAGKAFLTVLDFIGNYRRASFKLPFLVGVEREDPEAQKKARQAVEGLMAGNRPDVLPEGVEIRLEPQAWEALRESMSAGQSQREALLAAWPAMRQALGRAPTMIEAEVRGRFSVRQYLRTFDRWHGVLSAVGESSPAIERLEAKCGDFLREIERTPMTRSYKMVVLKAMLADQQLPGAIPVERLAAFFRTHFRKERYRADIDGTDIQDIEQVSDEVLEDYLLRNPINAWIGGNRGTASPWFAYDTGRRVFRYIGPRPDDDVAFRDALAERVEWRLHDYLTRPGPGSGVYKVVPLGKGDQTPLCVMFGNDSRMPRGWHPVRINGRWLYGNFKKVALNVMRERAGDDGGANCLTRELCALFAVDVPGRIASGRRVRVQKMPGEETWVIEQADRQIDH